MSRNVVADLATDFERAMPALPARLSSFTQS